VDFKKGAVNAAVPLRSQRLLEKQAQPEDAAIEATAFTVQDEYEFMRKSPAPARTFQSLMQLPLVIDDIDVDWEEDVVDTTDTMKSGQVTTSGPVKSGDVMGKDLLPAAYAVAARDAEESAKDSEVLVQAGREDIDSREVEGLL
jgi:hypothetical protein